MGKFSKISKKAKEIAERERVRFTPELQREMRDAGRSPFVEEPGTGVRGASVIELFEDYSELELTEIRKIRKNDDSFRLDG